GGVARAGLGKAAAALLCLRALPARRRVIGAERGRGVEARGAVAAITAEATIAALRLRHFDIGFRQLVQKPRGNIGLPQAVHAPVGGEINLGPLARPRDADMGKPALLFQPGAALIVERALVRK